MLWREEYESFLIHTFIVICGSYVPVLKRSECTCPGVKSRLRRSRVSLLKTHQTRRHSKPRRHSVFRKTPTRWLIHCPVPCCRDGVEKCHGRSALRKLTPLGGINIGSIGERVPYCVFGGLALPFSPVPFPFTIANLLIVTQRLSLD